MCLGAVCILFDITKTTPEAISFGSSLFAVEPLLRLPFQKRIKQCSNLRHLVQVTVKSGLNSGFSRSDCIFDSISDTLCDLKVVFLHILVCIDKVFIGIRLKNRTVNVERNIDVGVSKNLL